MRTSLLLAFVALGCSCLYQEATAFMKASPLSSVSRRAGVFARKSVVLKPTLIIQHTGGELSEDKKEAFLKEASKTVSSTLGKAESYVMVSLSPSTMSFGGKPGNAAFLYLASIGHIGPETNKPAARELTDLVEKHLGIPGDRVFIQFSDAAAANFAWQGNTFG
jgi:phenylpyruvate tautomerase